MNTAWKAGGNPGKETLERLITGGLTQEKIGERYGVTRSTVSYWMRSVGISRGVTGMNHKEVLPWDMKAADHQDGIARALRWYNRDRHGEELDAMQRREMQRLLTYLERRQVVVDYTREDGFVLRPRDPGLDAPDDVIRRPRHHAAARRSTS